MKKLFNIILIALFLFPFSLAAREVGDVDVPEFLNQGGINLKLNGAGVQSKFFFDIYVSALYLEHKSQDAETILRSDKPMAIRLHIVSRMVDSDSLKEAIVDGFMQSTAGNMEPIRNQVDQFLTLMNREINKMDYIDFIYLPETGTRVLFNNTFLDDIKGLSFKRAFFGIWLGEDPVDEDLKAEMLGL